VIEYRAKSLCPTCGQAMTVTGLSCDQCGTELRGRFRLTRFDLLSDEQIVFLERFLRARGNIRDVERETGLSYPTVRNRLDNLLRALGLDETRSQTDVPEAMKLAVLDGLADGSLNLRTAIQYLRGEDSEADELKVEMEHAGNADNSTDVVK